jgi:outer membrane protein assembly factor BamB
MPSFSCLGRLLLGALASICLVADAQADHWERFRGPNGNGICNDKNIPVQFGKTEGVLWKAKIAGDGASSPIIWGDRVFLQTASLDAKERSLLCIDAKTGTEIWKRSIPGIKPNQSIRKDSTLASATPTTDGKTVFVPFWNGKDILMIAYDFQGEKLWERNLGEFVSQHGAGASPILYKDLVIFSVDKDAYREVVDTTKKKEAGAKKQPTKKVPVPNASTLYGLDKKTGKTVWATPREAIRACYSIPFILDKPGVGPELIVTSTSAITGYDPMTGKANWYYTWTFAKDPLRTIASSVYADGVLLAMSGDGSGERLMVAVELKAQGKETQPTRVWANSKQFPYVTCPLIKGEYVYFVNDLGVAGCFHAKSGKQVWFERLPDAKFYASPIMIDGKMYAASEQGDLFVIDASPTYNLLAKNSFGERILATPAVADGRLFLRTQNHLYCVGKK